MTNYKSLQHVYGSQRPFIYLLSTLLLYVVGMMLKMKHFSLRIFLAIIKWVKFITFLVSNTYICGFIVNSNYVGIYYQLNQYKFKYVYFYLKDNFLFLISFFASYQTDYFGLNKRHSILHFMSKYLIFLFVITGNSLSIEIINFYYVSWLQDRN